MTGRTMVGLGLAVAGLLGAAVLVTPATAETVDPRVAEAQAAVQAYCTDLKDDATTTRQRNTRADLCAMWQAELADRTAVSPTPTQSPSQSPTASPSPPPASPSPTASPGPGQQFPNPSTAGVPTGWAPATVRTTDLWVTTAGAVVEDVELRNADIIVTAKDVTIRRVRLLGGSIVNQPGSSPCANGMLVQQVTLAPPPGAVRGGSDQGALRYGGYTADRVAILDRIEGFRVSGMDYAGCGPVTITNSYARINDGADCVLHADGLQGFDGNAVTVRNTTLEIVTPACPTAPFFYPSGQGNTSADIDGLLVKGPGYSFRLGMPARVRNLAIVDGSWYVKYGPIDVKCSVVTDWSARIVTISSDYAVTGVVRDQPCNTEGGT